MNEVIRDRYDLWCNDEGFDEATKQELLSIRDNEKEIEDRFYRDLEFGTGGLRGVMGAGTNRMNIYTVRKASQGLANYILREADRRSVAIAYDSRNNSGRFAEEAALCFAANGIHAYIFPSLRPTPMLSFALRYLHCTAGVVVTASHNPSEYNGYKVYWQDGAQITAPRDKEIIAEVNAITDFGSCRTMDRAEAEAAGLFSTIGEEVDEAYMNAVAGLALRPDIIRRQAKRLKIVYSPLHGTGNLPVRRILERLGFEQVYVVKEQELPDGNFPTVPYPNPEDPGAFRMALDLARKVDADIVLATDPDADRLGVYAKDAKTGTYVSFTGNMSGMLILDYILARKRDMGQIPENGAVVTTVVSGKMAKKVTEEYGVDLIETLTGFKYIGEQIKFFEESGSHEFLFGYEESYGCLVGTHARDKDAVVAVMALCETAAYCKHLGLTLVDRMEQLFATYGYFRESLFTITLKGMDGAEKIRAIMRRVRESIPVEIGGSKVLRCYDYEREVMQDLTDGHCEKTTLPKSNVLYFLLEDDAWCCIRPSGTEPKIKIYNGIKGSSAEDAQARLDRLSDALRRMIGEEAV